MKILVIAAHGSEEILGMGGTIAKYIKEGHTVYVCVAAIPTKDVRLTQRTKNESIKVDELLGIEVTNYLDLSIGNLKNTATVNVDARFEKYIKGVKPEIVFIPHKGGVDEDYRDVARASMLALRPTDNPQLKAIYAYETFPQVEGIPESPEDAFLPNCYSDITEYIEIKKEALALYKSQKKKFPHPRSEEAVEILSKMRGLAYGVENAEAFMAVRERI